MVRRVALVARGAEPSTVRLWPQRQNSPALFACSAVFASMARAAQVDAGRAEREHDIISSAPRTARKDETSKSLADEKTDHLLQGPACQRWVHRQDVRVGFELAHHDREDTTAGYRGQHRTDDRSQRRIAARGNRPSDQNDAPRLKRSRFQRIQRRALRCTGGCRPPAARAILRAVTRAVAMISPPAHHARRCTHQRHARVAQFAASPVMVLRQPLASTPRTPGRAQSVPARDQSEGEPLRSYRSRLLRVTE